MKTVKKEIELYIGATKWAWEKEFTLNVTTFGQESSNDCLCVNFSKIKVEIDVPDLSGVDLNEMHINELENIKIKYLAEVELKTRSLDDQIQNLKALPFNVEN